VGIALSATLLQRFQAMHRGDLIANVSLFNDATRERLAMLTNGMISSGAPEAVANANAVKVLDIVVTRQAMMLSFEQLFLLFGGCFVASLPLLLFMHKSRSMAGAGAAH